MTGEVLQIGRVGLLVRGVGEGAVKVRVEGMMEVLGRGDFDEEVLLSLRNAIVFSPMPMNYSERSDRCSLLLACTA